MKFLLKILIVILSAGVIVATPFIKNKNYKYYPVKAPSNQDKECTFCHNDIVKHKNLHAPVSDDCLNCHESISEKHPRAKQQDFKLIENSPDLCYICHEPKNEKKVLHPPTEAGECSACHSPHGTDNPFLLNKSSESDVCFECHDLEFKTKPNIHPPLELDGCKSCHDSHQSDFSYLLIKEKPELCISCHDNIAEEKKEEYLHAPFDDDCSNCHSPHNSSESYLLNEKLPELCFNCHDDIQSILTDSKYVHKVSENKANCVSCHSPHSSKNEKILYKEQTELCLTCHNKEINNGNRIISNIDTKLKTAKYKHAPVEEGCNTCHNPHASENFSLLNGKFPSEEYIKADVSSFELCFNCHDEGLLKDEYTETATNFRNGNKNMHYVHIHGEKGRSCGICHDVHASKNKFLIKKRTIFGTWNMPMNFKILPNGASCNTGCHTEKKYDRTASFKSSDNFVTDTVKNIAENLTDTVLKKDNVIAKQETDTVKPEIIPEEDKTGKDTVQENIAVIDNILEIPKDTLISEEKEKSETDSLLPDEKEIKEDIVVIDNKLKPDTVTDLPEEKQIDTAVVAVTDDKEVFKEEVKNEQPVDSVKKNDDVPAVISDTSENKVPEYNPVKNPETEFNKIKNLKIYFEFDKTEFSEPPEPVIEKIYGFMKEFPETEIVIYGYTDSKGSNEYNLNLSKKRAEKIKRILSAKGILPKRIKIVPMGEKHPAETNETEKGRAKNRRAEFELKK